MIQNDISFRTGRRRILLGAAALLAVIFALFLLFNQ